MHKRSIRFIDPFISQLHSPARRFTSRQSAPGGNVRHHRGGNSTRHKSISAWYTMIFGST
jgi:hypothetical protein